MSRANHFIAKISRFFLWLGTAALMQTAPLCAQSAPAIAINPVHDSDKTISGTSTVPSISLSLTVNGTAESTPQTADANGAFTFGLSAGVKTGNYIQVTGTSNGKTIPPGNTTVLAPAVTLSKPVISPAKITDTVITVTRASADASVSGLTITVSITPSKALVSNTCTPDDTSGICTVRLAPTVSGLAAGDTISASEVSGSTQGPAASFTIATPALQSPTISAATEGGQLITVTANKADLTQDGLAVNIVVPKSDGTSLSLKCYPDTTSGQCTVSTGPLPANVTVQASESANATAPGPKVQAQVAAIAALGKPTITGVNDGDDAITVAVNSSDKQTGLTLTVLVCQAHAGGPCSPAITPDETHVRHSCTPADSGNSCTVQLPATKPLLEGDTIVAWESFVAPYRASDPYATLAVGPRADLGILSIAPVKETDKTVLVTFNPNDVSRWGTSLTANISIYNAGSQVSAKTCTPTSGQNNCTVTLDSALAVGQVIHAYANAVAPASGAAPSVALPKKPGPEVLVNVPELGFDWGRVRAYFSLGSVFSRATTATGTTTTTNFSSPDVYAGLDMDFNWYSSQDCLAYPFGDDHVKLATLADAAAECAGRGSAKSKYAGTRNDKQELTNAKMGAAMPNTANTASVSNEQGFEALCENRPGSNTAAPFVTDKTLAVAMEFLYCIQKNRLPQSLSNLRDILDSAAKTVNAASPKSPDLSAALNQLASVTLTPAESQIILEQFGYEKAPKRGWMVNSYALTRLTQTQASNGFTLSTSSNSVHLEGGMYVPIYTSWMRWSYKGHPYTLFMAPIAKLGFDSLRLSGTDPIFAQPTSSTPSTLAQANYQNAVNALSKDVYRMMAFGGRLGLFELSPRPSRAPESIMNIDFTYGRYDNFFTETYTPSTGTESGGVRFPWRFGLNSRLQIPGTIFYLGSDLTKGVGPDSLTIYVGARADLSALLTKLIPTAQ